MVKIRQAKKSDLKALAKMDARIFPETTMESEAIKVFRHCLANTVPGACLVAEENGKIVGAMIAARKLTHIKNAAEVRDLLVDEKFRGKGIGKLLFRKSLSALKKHGITTVSLTVDPKNKRAYALYKKEGFVLFRHLLLKRF
jgi:ribosomal protein S18 acetylase RimI-like enzyme